MPALSTPYAVLDSFVQAMQLMLDLDRTKIERLKSTVTVLNIRNSLHTASCEVFFICFKPGADL